VPTVDAFFDLAVVVVNVCSPALARS
jgi:hypothetical protein